MLLTLAQVKDGAVGRSCGIATNTQDFVNIVNDATRQLMNRGNWWATVQPMVLPVSMATPFADLICPRGVESILAVNSRHRHPALMSNFWYRFLPWGRGFYDCLGEFGNNYDWRNHGGIAYGNGTTPVTNQIAPLAPMYVRAASSSVNDSGSTITFFGLDQNNNPAQATLTLTIPVGQTYPFASSATAGVQFSVIQRVVKDLSNGYITCQQDDNNGNLIPLSVYAPSEQTPEYVIMRLRGIKPEPNISVIATLSFIPALADTDNVLIENQDALRDMVLSIRKKEAGDIDGANAYDISAMRELNKEMKKRFPDEQFAVNFRPLSARGCNRITSMI